MENLAGSSRDLIVGAVVFLLLGLWVIGIIRKIGSCLIHLALLAAGLVILYYLVSVYQAVP